MHGKTLRWQIARLRLRAEKIALLLLPNHRSQRVINHSLRFALPDAAHHQNRRLAFSAQRVADAHALIHAAHAEPLRTGLGQHRRAQIRAMAVGVRLNHGENICCRSDRLAQMKKVVPQMAARNLCPESVRGFHADSIVNGVPLAITRPEGDFQSGCNRPGTPDARCRWGRCAAWPR
jgi:hypothetical protein